MAKIEISVVAHGYSVGPFEAELPDAVVKAAFERGTIYGLVIAPPSVIRGVEVFIMHAVLKCFSFSKILRASLLCMGEGTANRRP